MLKIGLQLVIWPSQLPGVPAVHPGNMVQSHPELAVQSAHVAMGVPVQCGEDDEPLPPELPDPPSGNAGTQELAHCTAAQAA